MLTTMFWLCSKSSLRMWLLCSLWKHMLHSHTESHSLLGKRLSIMNDQSRVLRLSLTLSVSHVKHMWMDDFGCFIIKSCECVLIWSPMHLSIIHTLSHFCWSFNGQTPLWQLDHHLAIDSIDCQPELRRNIKQVFSSCTAHNNFNPLS